MSEKQNSPKFPRKNNNNNDDDDDNNNQNQGPQFHWRGIVIFVLILVSIGLITQISKFPMKKADVISYSPEFLELVAPKDGTPTKIKNVKIIRDNSGSGMSWLEYQYLVGAETKSGKTFVDLQLNPWLEVFLNKNGIRNIEVVPHNNTFNNILYSILPVALFFLVIWFLFARQFKMASKGAFSFGKSKAKMLTRDKNQLTFKDVAGIEEAKEEVTEIVDFLKDPKRFQNLGGRIPKGILMVGPPGTGKTLLAKAIAGEADVPFFSISGSDFVEMFVGVGASRVRDMFEQGKKNAPCLIFIDEIDAVGRHRGAGMGGGHDEREQTLNALLVEMDGFDTQEGVIIIAATNRKDVLDPALLRPGRFDREVHVMLPDVKGREEILRVHVKKIKLADNVDLSVIAKGTPGFSGAELANLVNEAALLAAKYAKKWVTNVELEEARDKVRWGRERRSMAMSEKEKHGTAWHEAGHALVNVLLTHTHPLHKVTIIPRGPYLGATMYLPEGDKYSMQQKEALDLLAVTMAGRIAEQFYTGDISNGASGDIHQATHLARKMVCDWGMSELGMIKFGDDSEYVFLGRDMSKGREYSEKTAENIDAQIKRIIDEAYKRATDIIEAHRSQLEAIAQALLEYETLDGAQIKDLIETGKMSNPPSRPVRTPVVEKPVVVEKENKGLLPPGLQEAPAGA